MCPIANANMLLSARAFSYCMCRDLCTWTIQHLASACLHLCTTPQDDGYAGTLKNKRGWNDGGELGRDDDPLVPGKVSFQQCMPLCTRSVSVLQYPCGGTQGGRGPTGACERMTDTRLGSTLSGTSGALVLPCKPMVTGIVGQDAEVMGL
jgi:hypothetical protein